MHVGDSYHNKQAAAYEPQVRHEADDDLQGMAPARAEGPPLITAAPVMGIMLGLLRGCDDAEERISTLSNLKRLIGQLIGRQQFGSSCTQVPHAVLVHLVEHNIVSTSATCVHDNSFHDNSSGKSTVWCELGSAGTEAGGYAI